MNEFIGRIPLAFEFYEEGDLRQLDLKRLGHYLHKKTAIPVFHYGSVYDNLSKERIEAVASEFARIRVKDPKKSLCPGPILRGEIDYEMKRIRDLRWTIFGILYEGIFYQRVVQDLIPETRLDGSYCTILFTNQLFGTWDQNDRRYHARVSLYGFPHLISITGLVEAPAKPREFYVKKQMGLSLDVLKEEYRGRFLDHRDDRIIDVLKGYALQALLYQLTGNSFCEDQDCRFYNSHWQEDVIHSQLDGRYEFCPEHEGILRELRNKELGTHHET